MSDEITPEYIEDLKKRESLFAELAAGIEIETELRDNPVIRAILRAAQIDHDAALDELMTISPLESEKIARILVDVKTFRHIRKSLDAILSRGERAENIIRAQDKQQSYE